MKSDPFLKPIKYIGETAMEANRREGGGEPFFFLPVPLVSEKQMYYLRVLADWGLIGQKPEEVASFFITDGITKYMGNKVPENMRIYPPKSWKGFKA